VLNIQAATFAFATGSQTLAPPYPAAALFARYVPGMIWNNPDAPSTPLYASGS
jgi:hypothetical protein